MVTSQYLLSPFQGFFLYNFLPGVRFAHPWLFSFRRSAALASIFSQDQRLCGEKSVISIFMLLRVRPKVDAASRRVQSIFPTRRGRRVYLPVQGLAAAAFLAAIWPVHNASALFPPPLYIQPQNEPNSPALYNLGIGCLSGSTT